MIGKGILGLLMAAPLLLLPAAPALAETAAPACQFELGFSHLASLIPAKVGQCLAPGHASDDQGDMMQETNTGLLTWSKATNIAEFTNGTDTWVDSSYGLIMRAADVAYPWEGTTSLVAGIAIDSKGNIIDPATGQVLPKDARYKAS